ncbi:MAG TPA: hypothetical protein VG711_07320 [Phycisphaerales bacterium]|nr:hypothetical protein [Phycisphaerales bacterium]
MSTVMTDAAHVLDVAERKLSNHNAFGEMSRLPSRLQFAAFKSAEPAWYRLDAEKSGLFVSLVTPNRWLSESIEADLMHTGDDIEELVAEELTDIGGPCESLKVQHFRSDDMLYTFRSPLPVNGLSDEVAAEVACQCLLAYEAAFRQLGDMDDDSDDE